MTDRCAGPHELAALVVARWREEAHGPTLPRPAVDALLSQCYRASLTHEEGRPTTFRLALGEPDLFPTRAAPPRGLLRVQFDRPLPLDPHELRRLAPAASFHRSLLGARFAGDAFGIWGLVHSGPRWLQSIRGGRDIQQAIPGVIVVAVTGPGRLLVSRGVTALGELTGGVLTRLRMDIFSSRWLVDSFVGVFHADPAALDPSFVQLVLHVLRRVVATIRATRHGGTIVFLSPADGRAAAGEAHVSLKYAFRDEEPRRRIRTLIEQVMAEAARGGLGPVTWEDYEAMPSRALDELDEALFEAAHFVATMTGVDGAVVLTRGFEVLGFGGEISGELPEVGTVARALDLEAERCEDVRADRVGTRHRSAYRLCAADPDALAVVVSQDGGVRFVRQHRGAVTFWNQVATGPWEV